MLLRLSGASARTKAILVAAGSVLVLVAVTLAVSKPDFFLNDTSPTKDRTHTAPGAGSPAERSAQVTSTASTSGSGRSTKKPQVKAAGSTRAYFAYQVEVPKEGNHINGAEFFVQRTDGADRTLVYRFPGFMEGVCGGGTHLLTAVSRDRGLLANISHQRDCGGGKFEVTVVDRSSNIVFKNPIVMRGGRAVAFSPDSRQIALANIHPGPREEWVDVLSLKDGSVNHRFAETNPADITWGPSGMLAYTTMTEGAVDNLRTAHIVIANPDGSGRRELASGSHPLWLNGTHVVFSRADGLYVYDTTVRPGVAQTVERRFGPNCGDPEVLDGDGIVCFSGDGEIWVVEVSSGKRTAAASGIEGPTEIAVVGADEIVFGAKGTAIYSLVIGNEPVKIGAGSHLR